MHNHLKRHGVVVYVCDLDVRSILPGEVTLDVPTTQLPHEAIHCCQGVPYTSTADWQLLQGFSCDTLYKM